MAIRKSKKIRQVAPERGKITNTEGQVGDVKTMCYVIAEHDILERTDGHGDTTSLLVLGCDWTGLELSMGTLHQWLNRTCLVQWLRWPWLLAWLRCLWMLRWLNRQALLAAVAEMVLVTAVAKQALLVAVTELALVAAVAGLDLVAAVAELALVA